jgi:vacuolar-type H+-ATPase subunit F/Vma7
VIIRGFEMGKIRVFISSSLTELESEREIAQETIAQLNLEPVMFESLPAMDKPLESAYLDEIRNSHIFVLILWKDLTDAVEREYNAAVENGVPVLLLVKVPTHRETRSPRLESLIDRTVECDLVRKTQCVPFRKKFRTLSQLRYELKEGVMKLVSDRFTEPVLTTTNIDVISKTNQNLILNARRRLLFVSKTPIILFGPRPYNSEHKNYVEGNFYQALTSWIDEIKNDKNRKMLYLYSSEDTYNEMKENKLESCVEQNLEKYKKIEDETNGRFEISSIQEFPGRILISDNSFGIQFRAPKDKVVCVYRQDASISSNLFEVFCEYRGAANRSLVDLLSELKPR